MSVNDAGHHRSLAPIGELVACLLAAVGRARGRTPEDQLREDLERIALSAPHLLVDIGFVRDPKASSPVMTTWYRGPLRVAISSRDGSVSVLRR